MSRTPSSRTARRRTSRPPRPSPAPRTGGPAPVGRSALVVGAGVAGLATALGLRHAGWQVTVLERRAEPDRYGTAFGLHPSAQSALERLDPAVADAVHRQALPYRDAHIRRPDGTVLARLPLERIERRAGRPELLVSRPRLIDALLDGLAAAGVAVAHGHPLEPGAADGHALLVGADGIGSAVRRARFAERGGVRRVGTVAWIGTAEVETGVYGETWGAGRFFGMTPVEPGRTNWYATVRVSDGAADAERAAGAGVGHAGSAVGVGSAASSPTTCPAPATGAARAADPAPAAGATPAAEGPRVLRALFDGWHAPVRQALDHTDPDTCVRYEMRHLHPALPSFVDGGGPGPAAALVGDAAHAMTPNLGQGACQALLDAEALTRALARHPGEPSRALRAYDAERRRPAQRVALASRTLHRVMSTRHTGPRDAVLRLLP